MRLLACYSVYTLIVRRNHLTTIIMAGTLTAYIKLNTCLLGEPILHQVVTHNLLDGDALLGMQVGQLEYQLIALVLTLDDGLRDETQHLAVLGSEGRILLLKVHPPLLVEVEVLLFEAIVLYLHELHKQLHRGSINLQFVLVVQKLNNERIITTYPNKKLGR